MEKEKHIIPEPAVKRIATGLCMMTFFTLMWAGVAFSGFSLQRSHSREWGSLLQLRVTAFI